MAIRRALVTEAIKRPGVTLKNLERSTDQTGEAGHRTTLVWMLHKTGLYGRVMKRMQLGVWRWPKDMLEAHQTCGKCVLWSVKTKIELFLALAQKLQCS